jgi:tetratricopeptide (TPR) repeat protein
MFPAMFRRAVPAVLALLMVAALALPAAAQTTGMVKGVVTGPDGKPVDGARVTIEFVEGVTRKFATKTNRRGEFVQIGLQGGTYRVTAEKEKVGSAEQEVRVSIGQTAELSLALRPGGAGPPTLSKEEIAKRETLKKLFEEGVAASRAGNHDGAIQKYHEALEVMPDCADCYYNIGFAHVQKQELDQAEAAYKRAIEVKPDHADSYSALANVYNMQKRYDEAAKMSAEAAKFGGGAAAGAVGADAAFNQAVMLWNAGNIAEAKKQFEEAARLNPAHADAHYWLGMANLNEGKMPEAVAAFEKYLQIAPTGQYAEQAKSVVQTIKQ